MGKSATYLALSQEEVIESGISMPKTMEIIERLLALQADGGTVLPSKVSLTKFGGDQRNRINALPAYVGGEFEVAGIKWIAGFPENPKKYGIPRAHAMLVLNDVNTGAPIAVMDGTYISAMRTGAITGIAAKYLAQKKSRSVGLIGCGVQARTQALGILSAIPSINTIRAYSLHRESSEQFVEWLRGKTENKGMSVNSAEEAVRGADIVVTATVADEPIINAEWMQRGSFFLHLGSYQEEEDEAILQADKIVVDDWAQIKSHGTSRLAKMYKEGKLAESRIHANLGEIILGRKRGRENDNERTFFYGLGMGTADMAVASFIYAAAKSKGIGQVVKLWDRPAIG